LALGVSVPFDTPDGIVGPEPVPNGILKERAQRPHRARRSSSAASNPRQAVLSRFDGRRRGALGDAVSKSLDVSSVDRGDLQVPQ
jgi:hypothetical protein